MLVKKKREEEVERNGNLSALDQLEKRADIFGMLLEIYSL